MSDPVKDFYDAPSGALSLPLSNEQASLVGADGDEYPAPSVASSEGLEPGTWPGPVLALERLALRYGWNASKAWARGCMPHATTGRAGPERDSYSVRFVKETRGGRTLIGSWQGYAIFSVGAWQSIMVAGRSLPPFGKLGRTQLGEWLSDPDRPDEWYDAIRRRRAEQDAAAKERAAARPKKSTSEEAS